ncbi:hypothetical protein YB2330_002748 [Saitoella coloradoensis]|nr:uncharacterized protein SAICODRAFT_19469 [Saitoella complicata NRRL Y-17804]ODQ52666.1 hypothetical protein SAICODRAFT_19469 [Saitoella complicata NRRL Y-17804]
MSAAETKSDAFNYQMSGSQTNPTSRHEVHDALIGEVKDTEPKSQKKAFDESFDKEDAAEVAKKGDYDGTYHKD